MATFSASSIVVAEPRAGVRPQIATTRPRLLAVGFVGILLAFLAATTLIACAFAMRIPQDLDEGEPVIYGLAQRILDGQSLYQPGDQVQAYYTPLYLYVIAVLRRVHLTGFAPGRAVTFAAGMVATCVLAYLARRYAGSWWAGLLAALMFLGLGFPMAPVPFLALERVDVLGVAFSFGAIAILSRGTARGQLLLAGVAAGLALLTKQSLFAAGLVGTVWLLTINWRNAVEFAASTAATFLVPSMLFQWSSGGYFWDNIGLANATLISIPDGLYLFEELVVFQGVLFIMAAASVVRIQIQGWRDPGLRLISMYWLATLVPVAGIIKMGANHNYWIELAGADAVLATLYLWAFLNLHERGMRAILAWIPVCLLLAQLGLMAPARLNNNRDVTLLPLTGTLQFGRLVQLVGEGPDFSHLVADVSYEPGLVISESMDIAALGNHPLVIEPFAFRMAELAGRWNSGPLVKEICSGHVTLLVLSYPIESETYPGAGLAWPRSVLTALRLSMRYEQIRAFHWLYRSIPSPDPQTIASCEAAAAAERSRAPL